MKRSLLLVLAYLFFSAAGFSSPVEKPIPLGEYTEGLENKELLESAEFLLKHMPARDKGSLPVAIFQTHIQLAHKARESFPWGKKIPLEVFHNDVLPYVSLNEKREDWRTDFSQRFGKIVKDAATVEEAVSAITQVIEKELGVKYSTKRKKPDQSPSESMEQGVASCTGLSILLVNACRAVGIPARVAGIPSWTTMRGNHNWIEVYTPSDGKWHFTEYNADKKGLDHGWFAKHAAQANPESKYHRIYASSWKSTGTPFPLVWDLRIQYVNAVDVTERYKALAEGQDKDEMACELRIAAIDPKGNRIAIPVHVLQGDAKIGSGNTPKPTDDMNKFLSIDAKKGQLYSLLWNDPASGKRQQRMIHCPKDKGWLEVTLEMGRLEK